MSEPGTPARFEAVVIGGSAGAVDALCAVLPSLPGDLCIPVLIVLHLQRQRPSQLAEVFGEVCRCPVCEPSDKDPIEPGVVYVAPPDYHMLVDDGPRIALSADELVHFSRPAIDVLFQSAAEFYGERLLGIMLSGANDDGAEGLAAIRSRGGVCVVQQPESASSPYMVLSALRRVPDSRVLSLPQLGELLRNLNPVDDGCNRG